MDEPSIGSSRVIHDKWIEQRDLLVRITETEAWTGDMVEVYGDRTSYIEYYIGLLLPLGPRQIASALEDTNWGDDYRRARFKLKLESRGHFLSGSFRSFHGLELRGSQYADRNGEVAAWRRIGGPIGGSHVQQRSIAVRRDLLHSFLREKNQRLLFCFRSHRFSERAPRELNLQPRYETIRNEMWHYIREYRDISDEQNVAIFDRERMRTFSFLFGKSSCPSQVLS